MFQSFRLVVAIMVTFLLLIDAKKVMKITSRVPTIKKLSGKGSMKSPTAVPTSPRTANPVAQPSTMPVAPPEPSSMPVAPPEPSSMPVTMPSASPSAWSYMTPKRTKSGIAQWMMYSWTLFWFFGYFSVYYCKVQMNKLLAAEAAFLLMCFFVCTFLWVEVFAFKTNVKVSINNLWASSTCFFLVSFCCEQQLHFYSKCNLIT